MREKLEKREQRAAGDRNEEETARTRLRAELDRLRRRAEEEERKGRQQQQQASAASAAAAASASIRSGRMRWLPSKRVVQGLGDVSQAPIPPLPYLSSSLKGGSLGTAEGAAMAVLRMPPPFSCSLEWWTAHSISPTHAPFPLCGLGSKRDSCCSVTPSQGPSPPLFLQQPQQEYLQCQLHRQQRWWPLTCGAD